MASDTLMTLGIAAAGVIVVVFGWDLLTEKDAERAARRTSQRTFGVASGVLGAMTAGLVAGVEVLAEFPGLVFTGLGSWAILKDISLGMWVAVGLLTYVVLSALGGRY